MKNESSTKKKIPFRERIDSFKIWLKKSKVPSFIIFIIIGTISTVWFLIRVIPKPSRAAYPCMKVAAPFMSSFVIYLVTLSGSIIFFKKARQKLLQAKYVTGGLFLLAAIASGIIFTLKKAEILQAKTEKADALETNSPMGTAQGIHPGRVVWVWDPDATNENCTGTDDGYQAPAPAGHPNGPYPIDDNDDFYFQAKNNDLDLICGMVSDLVQNVSGETNDSLAWDALFKSFNNKKYGATDQTFTCGEKIFIKINAGGPGIGPGTDWAQFGWEMERQQIGTWSHDADIVETTPQVAFAFLHQLINKAGIPQENIYIGDPIKNIYKDMYDFWSSYFPDVNYLGNDIHHSGLAPIEDLGRTPVEIGTSPQVYYSDKGSVLTETSDRLYTVLETADYMINIAALKAHARNGITLCSKNHFGSHTRDGAGHLHNSLLAPDASTFTNTGYGKYRVLVDIMGHELLGGNTMLFVVDGLYSSEEEWSNAFPVKWDMAPFNNDWTSSIFASQDQVALESVCFDFLRTEYDGTDSKTNRPNETGVDDYLEQAADPTNWASGITYDPENDGTPITSLGVHEHWNNSTDKQYTRDLGTGSGIELFRILNNSSADESYKTITSPATFCDTSTTPPDTTTPPTNIGNNGFNGVSVFPVPASQSITISFSDHFSGFVNINIHDLSGRQVKTMTLNKLSGIIKHNLSITDLQTGTYIIEIKSGNNIYRKTILKNE